MNGVLDLFGNTKIETPKTEQEQQHSLKTLLIGFFSL